MNRNPTVYSSGKQFNHEKNKVKLVHWIDKRYDIEYKSNFVKAFDLWMNALFLKLAKAIKGVSKK